MSTNVMKTIGDTIKEEILLNIVVLVNPESAYLKFYTINRSALSRDEANELEQLIAKFLMEKAELNENSIRCN